MGNVSPRGFFITGTDTGVGKTMLTCLLARTWPSVGRTSLSVPNTTDEDVRRTVAAYKPVCSGATHREGALPTPSWSDIEELYAATNAVFPRERLCPQTFLAPLSPPAAAALEGREVNEALLLSGYHWLAERAERVLVEGAGGFYSPISTNWLNADLADRIGLPVIIVAPNRLGTINQTLLTIEAIRQRGLTVAGVVLNHLSESADPSTATNASEIETRGDVRVLGEIKFRGLLPDGIIKALSSIQ